MATRFSARPMLCVLGLSLFGLTACDKLGGTFGSQGEMGWARKAIERNGQLEIVAADSNAAVFTVRVKNTGDLRTVRADEVIGALPGSEIVKPAVEPSAAPAATPAVPPPAQTTSTAEPGAGDFAQPGDVAMPVEQNEAPPVAAAVPTPTGKGVIAAGPGYSIQRGTGSNRSAFVPTSTSASSETRSPATASLERRNEPIVCQGGRLLHIDNRNLEFTGDAVSAEDGCEIHITNSRISARGVGIFARAANVHIKNSSIEGTSGSVEATHGAQVYVQSSTFKGLSRRQDTAALHDLGGNVWN